MFLKRIWHEAFIRAKKAYKELNPSFFSFKKAKDFARVAGKYSDDRDSAARGGLIEVDIYECRNAIEYTLLHGFHKEIFQLKPGDISDVFEFKGDYYIVQVREMEKRREMSFEEVKERVKKDLEDKEHGKVMGKWEDDLLRSAGFVIHDQILKATLSLFHGKFVLN